MKKNLAIYLIVSLMLSVMPVFAQNTGNSAASDFASQAEAEAKKNIDPLREKAKKYFKYGDKLFKRKKYLKAVKYYYAATKTDPNYIEAWKQVGFCYYKTKKHKFALKAFKNVIELDPKDKDAIGFISFYDTLIAKNTKKNEKREMIDSVWRAAVFPGFGQIHNNQMLKGILISSVFLVSTGLTIYNVIDQNAKVDKYENTNENHDIAYREAEDAGLSVLVFGCIAGALYTAGIIDAAINYNSEEAKMFNVYINDESISIMASIRY